MLAIPEYTCYRTHAPLVIDGRLDEPAWKLAPASSAFVDIVTGEPAWFDTRVRLLWDDANLYFGFTAEETDVWGTLTERDSKIWEENDLEIFIAGKDAYYEFEINALNVIYEVFWIWTDVHRPGGPYWGRPEFDPRPSAPWCSMASAGTCMSAASVGASSTGIAPACATQCMWTAR